MVKIYDASSYKAGRYDVKAFDGYICYLQSKEHLLFSGHQYEIQRCCLYIQSIRKSAKNAEKSLGDGDPRSFIM